MDTEHTSELPPLDAFRLGSGANTLNLSSTHFLLQLLNPRVRPRDPAQFFTQMLRKKPFLLLRFILPDPGS